MDEMKLKLSTPMMRGLISKLISMAIRRKLGYKVDVHFNELDVRFIDGETSISTNVEVKLDSKEFMRLVKSVGLD